MDNKHFWGKNMAVHKKVKSLWADFSTFAFKGSVFNTAVAVIIGGAFGKIVASIVNDLFLPLLGAVARVDTTNWYVILRHGADGLAEYATKQAALDAGAVIWAYGDFISVVVDFFLVTASVFLFVRLLDKLSTAVKNKESIDPPPPAPRLCPYCKQEIHAEATRCPHCTSQLNEEEQP